MKIRVVHVASAQTFFINLFKRGMGREYIRLFLRIMGNLRILARPEIQRQAYFPMFLVILAVKI